MSHPSDPLLDQGLKSVQVLLKSAASGSDAFRKLLQLRKQTDKNFSLAQFARLMGISSKGYLSDVASGRRKLGLRYLNAAVSAFQLEGQAARLFRMLVEIDHEADERNLAKLRVELRNVAKAMSIEETPLPLHTPTNTVVFEVFCAFGLFKGRPTTRDLLSYFPSYSASEIESALRLLERHCYIKREGRKYVLACEEIRFLPTRDHSENIALIRDSIQRSADSVDRYYDQPEVALFEALVLSTKTATLKKQLGEIKAQIRQLSSNLEEADADTLVRLNLQLHPLP